jgi:hypothetical protein
MFANSGGDWSRHHLAVQNLVAHLDAANSLMLNKPSNLYFAIIYQQKFMSFIKYLGQMAELVMAPG